MTDPDSLSYALIGAAGYVAPRHMQAIRDTGGDLACALDPSDSVGVLDRYFPQAQFFTEFERFDRHIYKLKRRGAAAKIDYVSICSPNYLHDAHVRFALRSDADAICEKPLVLNPWNLDALREMSFETGRAVHAILQLRLHPAIVALRERVRAAEPSARFEVTLTYVAARGAWYGISWKGAPAKSGGVPTNIGVHFFDVLAWIFGAVDASTVHLLEPRRASGVLELARARVRWFLSVDAGDLPDEARAGGLRTVRALTLGEAGVQDPSALESVDFSAGFETLHTEAYRRILAGDGFGIDDAAPSIALAAEIRQARPRAPRDGEPVHPLTLLTQGD